MLYFTGPAGATSFSATIRLEVDGILLACQYDGSDRYCSQPNFERVINIPLNTVIGLTMTIGGNGPFDFSHTAIFDWILPDDVQFASASGAFLTGDVSSPVDDPAGFALFLAGLSLLAGLATTKRRTANDPEAN